MWIKDLKNLKFKNIAFILIISQINEETCILLINLINYILLFNFKW